jgi:hypothetical protein
MNKIKKDNKFAIKVKSLGALGELIAIKVLVDNDFEKIRNLNDQKKNFPYGDLYAEKDGKRYVISVKSRNKYQRSGKLNSRYNLGERCYDNAKTACHKYKAEPFWMAVQFFGDKYSAYFGSLSQLEGKKGIPMGPAHIPKYICLAEKKEHGIDFKPYLNIYKEDKPKL